MATRYHELTIQGPKGWALGFVRGFLRGRDADGRVIDAEGEGFDCEPFREQIGELLHPGSETLHLLVPEPLQPLVREAVDRGAEQGEAMAIRHSRAIAGARFEFSFTLYSRQHGARIRHMLENPPPGTRLSEETRFEETAEPGEKGLDMYAPVHSYELRAEGAVEGDLEGVLTLYRACRHEELIRTKPARLIGGEPKGAGKKRPRR